MYLFDNAATKYTLRPATIASLHGSLVPTLIDGGTRRVLQVEHRDVWNGMSLTIDVWFAEPTRLAKIFYQSSKDLLVTPGTITLAATATDAWASFDAAPLNIVKPKTIGLEDRLVRLMLTS
jgi:hypothetical protein